MGNDYDPRLFACFDYTETRGVTCDTCCGDKKLKGPFSEKKPVQKFSYTNLKDHAWTKKHTDRMDDDLKMLHPKTMAKAMKEKVSSEMKTVIMSPLEKALVAIKLLHMKCKEGLPDLKVRKISNFIKNNCNETIAHNLSSIHNSDEILNAAILHQINCDDIDLLGVKRDRKVALAFDGSTQRQRDMKIFFGKGWKPGSGSITKYVMGLDPQKNVLLPDVDLSDLLSIDTGDDNVAIIEKVVTHRLKIQWRQLLQLAVDGASNNMGHIKGCAAQVHTKSL